MRQISILISFLFLSFMASAQRLERFAGKDAGGKMYGYPHIKNYFGFLDERAIPDSVSEGRQFYFLYFTLSDTLPDIGIRIINPVPTMCMPDKGDVVTENYYEHEQEKSGRFNTWIALELQNNNSWQQIAFNDDGREGVEATNSVIRIHDKNLQIVPGAYRIVISSQKPEKLKGGFLVQVGSFSNIKQLYLTK